jgi:hypothetical protein
MSMCATRATRFGRLTAIAVLSIGFAASPVLAQSETKPAAKKASNVDITLVSPAPGPKAGDNQFEVMVKDANGQPIADAEVSVSLVMAAMPAMKMPEMRNDVKLKPAGGGKYTSSGSVPMAGKWKTTITVKKSGKEIGHKTITLTAK